MGTDESNTIIQTPILGWFNKVDNIAAEILVSLHMKHNVVVNHRCCPARDNYIEYWYRSVLLKIPLMETKINEIHVEKSLMF